MKKLLAITGGALLAILILSAACGGGGDNSSATPSATATKSATTPASGTPAGSVSATPTVAQLSTYLSTLTAVMNNTITKANAGDVQGTRDAEGEGDTAMEAIIKALKAANSPLASQLEQLELDYEGQADATNTDVSVIAKDAQSVLSLLGEVSTTLHLGSAAATSAASGTPVSSAALSAYFTSLRQVMNNTIAKANAGDVQGTRDAEGEGDAAMEAIIKALRAANSPLGDQLEKLELDYEGQADATNTDVSVIAKDAQAVLPLLDQAAAVLHVQ